MTNWLRGDHSLRVVVDLNILAGSEGSELSALRMFSGEGIQRRLIRAHEAKLRREKYQKFIYCKDDLEYR